MLYVGVKDKRSQAIRGFRYPRLILEHKRCKFYLVYLSKFNFPSNNLFTRFDETAIPKPTRNTRKIANKLMTVASGEINLHDRTHVAKVKAAFHSWRNTFFSISSNPTLR